MFMTLLQVGSICFTIQWLVCTLPLERLLFIDLLMCVGVLRVVGGGAGRSIAYSLALCTICVHFVSLIVVFQWSK